MYNRRLNKVKIRWENHKIQAGAGSELHKDFKIIKYHKGYLVDYHKMQYICEESSNKYELENIDHYKGVLQSIFRL